MITIKNEGNYSEYHKRIEDMKARKDYKGLEEIRDEIYDDGENLSISDVANLATEIHNALGDKKESVMNYRIPLSFVTECIKTKDFYNNIIDLYKVENEEVNYEQINRDLAHAINFTQRMSAVARPINCVIKYEGKEDKVTSPRENVIIEVNNRIYNLTGEEFDLYRIHENEKDMSLKDDYDKSLNEDKEETCTCGHCHPAISENYYKINSIIEKMYRDYLRNR